MNGKLKEFGVRSLVRIEADEQRSGLQVAQRLSSMISNFLLKNRSSDRPHKM